MHKFIEGDRVVIAADPEASGFAGRVGEVRGWTKPSISGEGPVRGRSSDDFASSVYFEDSGEQEWFVHSLLLPGE